MGYRFMRRKIRCFLKHGPHGCPHIERHTRRKRAPRSERKSDPPAAPVQRQRRVARL